MSDHSSYPTSEDVRALVEAFGFLDINALVYDYAIADAIAAWKRDTGWDPYLSDGSSSTEYYSPEELRYDSDTRRYGLRLRNGAVSVTSVTVEGVALTLNSDYWLIPNQGEPYREITFLSPPCGDPLSIVVVLVAGKVAALSDDEFKAIVKGAASSDPMLAVMGIGGLGGSVKQGPVEISGVSSEAAIAESMPAIWRKQYNAAANYAARFSAF